MRPETRLAFVLLCSLGGCTKADHAQAPEDGRPARRGPVACAGDRLLTGSQIGTQRFRPGSLDVLQISADGQQMMTAGGSKVILWDPQTGQRRKTFDAWMGAASLSADGKRVAVADSGLLESRLVIVETASGDEVHAWPMESGEVDQVAIGPAGQRVAIARDGVVELRDAQQTKRLGALDEETRTLAFSGARVAAGGAKGQLRLWDVETGTEINLDTDERVHVMATSFSADGAVLAAVDTEGQVRLFDAADGTPRGSFDATAPGEPSELRKVAVSNGARRVLVGSWSGVISLWDPQQTDPVAVLAEGLIVSGGVAFTPDGETAVAAVHEGAIRFWDAQSGAERPAVEPGNMAAVDGVIWLDQHRVVTAAGGHAANVWDLRCGELEAQLDGHERRVEHVVASRDAGLLVTGDAGGSVRVWDGASLKLKHHDDASGDAVDALAISGDGRRLALARRSGLTVRDEDFAVVWAQPRGSGDDVYTAVAAAPDGSLLVVGDSMGKLRWLDMRSGGLLAVREDDHASNIRAIRFSPSGDRLATAASDTIRIYDAKTGQLQTSMSTPGWSVSDPSWFSDEVRLGFGDSDGHLWIVDATSGDVMRSAAVEDLDIGVVAVRADDQALVTGHDDSSTRVWLPGELTDVADTPLEVTRQFTTGAPPLLSGSTKQCPANTKDDELPGCATAERITSTFLVRDNGGDVALSRDGALLASPSGEQVSIIEVANGSVRSRLGCCEYGGPEAAAFSADASRIAITAGLGKTRTWSVNTGLPTSTWNVDAVVIEAAEGGTWAAASEDGGLFLIDAEGKISKVLAPDADGGYEAYDARTQLSFSSDGSELLVRTSASLELWDTETGEVSDPFSGGDVPDPVEDTEWLLWSSLDAEDRLELVTTGHRYTQKKHGAWSPRATPLRLREADALEDFACASHPPSCAALTEDGLAVGSKGKPSLRVPGEIAAYAFARSGERIAISDGRGVGVWDVATGRRLTPEPIPAPRRIAMLPEGLATSHDDHLRLWKPNGASRSLALSLTEIAPASDGHLLGLDDEGLVRVALETGTRTVLSAGSYWDMAVSGDGTRVVVLMTDDDDVTTLRVIDVADGREVWTRLVPGGRGIALSEDGTKVAFGTPETVELWELGKRRVATMQVEHDVSQLAFTREEAKLVTLGNGHIDVYDTTDGRELESFADGLGINVFVVAPDGRTLVTGGDDGLLRLFDVAEGRQIAGVDGHDAPIDDLRAGGPPLRVATMDARGRTLEWDLSPLLE